MIKLTTERLILEPMSLTFCTQNYVEWLNDPDVYKFLETRGNQTLQSLESFILNQMEQKNYFWAITLRENGKHIGNVKIDNINLVHSHAEYGILMGDKKEWGKSYAKEASERVINYFFNEEFFLRKINLGLVKDNVNALNLYLKMGFVQEGLFKDHVMYDHVSYDLIRMAKFNTKYE